MWIVVIKCKWTGTRWAYPKTFDHHPTQGEIDAVMSGIEGNNTFELIEGLTVKKEI